MSKGRSGNLAIKSKFPGNFYLRLKIRDKNYLYQLYFSFPPTTLEGGADVFFVKPFGFEFFGNSVKNHVAGSYQTGLSFGGWR
jgi:hypothetical protein